ncbi:H/ACA ribonucleoprotein complex non-core subunit NAF1-like [Peromyscus leucopus]|uniref:H/ACA ribonucleoprotein complex non-core subunit NAF1-like n=1 Tax=Peromyscus leucopus TaxID=10041 RepID=UPI0018853C41|nr:H/ACA ribonucleoprotein complex non-core subunit NAF1-like [Peromyscus leucopus]
MEIKHRALHTLVYSLNTLSNFRAYNPAKEVTHKPRATGRVAHAHGRASRSGSRRHYPETHSGLSEESSRAAPSGGVARPGCPEDGGAGRISPPNARASDLPPPLHPTCLAAGRLPPPPRLKLQPPEPQSPPPGNAESDFRDVARVTRAPPPRLCVHPASPSAASQNPRPVDGWGRVFSCSVSIQRAHCRGLKGALVISLEKSPKETFLCTPGSAYRTYLPSLFFTYLKIFLTTYLCVKHARFTRN